jgi:hypothetical protein
LDVQEEYVTAGSSMEAEMFDFLGVQEVFVPDTNIIYNDNRENVDWSQCCTTKGLWHIKMKENNVKENKNNKFVTVPHVDGKKNMADIITNEMKDVLVILFLYMILW